MASLFFSYSHKDEALRDQLEAHLALLRNQGLLHAWHDRRIVAGEELDPTILRWLDEANIILLLISADFLASSYCFSKEMARAMVRHETGEARVIPVILRPCDWHSAPFGKLLAVPKDGKAVTSWPDRDEAFADIARNVRKAIEELKSTATPAAQVGAAAVPTRPINERAIVIDRPRSSNLRLKKEFSDQDRDKFIRDAYEYVCRFFEASVAEVGDRNPGITGTYERIDTRRMAAVLYRGGKKIAECSVRMEGLTGRSNGLAFSHDSSAASGSFNELLSIGADDLSLHLKSMGMAWSGLIRDQHLSEEGAAEFLWDLFIRQAQQ